MKIITPVVVEPVTLAEAKQHLRLDSASAAENITTYQSITPGSHAIAEYIGAGVDVLGKIAIVNLNAGAVGTGGKVDAKIQESNDGASYTDWPGGVFGQVTSANDKSVQEIEYAGMMQYIRAVATVATAACEFGVDVLVQTGSTVEDELILSWITAAREYAEGYTGRALATQTLELAMGAFPAGNCFELPMPPLQSVDSIKYKDADGIETTIETDVYIVDTDSEPGLVFKAPGKSWPIFAPYPVNPIRVQYVTGYCAENPLPKSLWAGMLIHIGLMYKHRDTEVPSNAQHTVKTLYAPYKVRWF